MTNSVRAKGKALTRARIVKAAIEAFSELGYRSTTMSHVADRAGIGRATLYLHFASKHDLADEIARSIEPRMIRVVRSLSSVALSEEGISKWVDSVITGLRSFGTVTGVVNDAIGHNPDLALSLMMSMRRASAGVLAELSARGWRGTIDSGALAVLLTATMQLGSSFFAGREKESTSVEEQEALVRLWLLVLTN
ncbi:AcrR family transcriptional regulator [Microbacterium endophyticum]|uniref:AcrR family transcriptional regulator n=1 Tax=Microbacterium endophyticum TaxID=1526412 RepID=A0A7W4V2F6_9MICO|nr:TetR/AcrR family transcriptional regulator [Microbacterium endophyticum]MBB2975080.1 AcrR family transcriptional regulator [Microbacterium endophyticum]NIK37380.1 AcrR family transcriptional regulator [Microbacterium endophyticum]